MPLRSENATVISSKGGRFDFGGKFGGSNVLFGLSGAEWEGLSWIEFEGCSGAGAPCIFIDDVTFRVPEPGSLTLAGIGVAALLLVHRRRKQALSPSTETVAA